MSKVDWFGHWFYFFLFVGMLLIQAKDFRGWLFRFAGEVGWIGIGFIMGMTSIWAWGFAFLAVDVMGYLKWKKEHRNDVFTDGLDNSLESANERLMAASYNKPMWEFTHVPASSDVTTEVDVQKFIESCKEKTDGRKNKKSVRTDTRRASKSKSVQSKVEARKPRKGKGLPKKASRTSRKKPIKNKKK